MAETCERLRKIMLCDLNGVLVTLPHRVYVESRLAHPFSVTDQPLSASFLAGYDRHEEGFGQIYETLLVDGLQRGELQASALEGVLELFSPFQAPSFLSTVERASPPAIAVYSTCLPRAIDLMLEQTGLASFVPPHLRYSSFEWSYRSSEQHDLVLGDGGVHRDPSNRKTPEGFLRIACDLRTRGYRLSSYIDDNRSELLSAQTAFDRCNHLDLRVHPITLYWCTSVDGLGASEGIVSVCSFAEASLRTFNDLR